MKLTLLVLAPLLPIGLGVAGLVFVFSGAYNPAADSPHWAVTHKVLETVRIRGITARSDTIAVPNLDDPALIQAGAGNYAAMCAGCHLAPGEAEGELGRGLYPSPPNLSAVDGLDPAQTFWVIKHGVKMTGMPAWGKSMDNATIWGLTAFVRALPSLDAERYAALVASSGGHDHGGGGMDHGAMPGMEGGGKPAMAGMDHHGAMPGMKGGGKPAMAGMDHGDMPGMEGGGKPAMAGMDHGAMPGMEGGGKPAMAGMDHGTMPGMDGGGKPAMAGMDHGAMPGSMAGGNMASSDPIPRRISGTPEQAFQAFYDALQVGNEALATERLAPDLVFTVDGGTDRSRDAYARGPMKDDMSLLKRGKLEVTRRDVQAGERQSVVVSEVVVTDAGVAMVRRETATLRNTPEGWKISRLTRTDRLP